MSLSEYRRRRRFAATPEPRGDKRRARIARRRALAFVVQKHRASSLHYDFRLEWKGVLLSWAIPKGPSRSPSVKRLAMPTEDHPLEYGRFRGVIPEGQYGAGKVEIWDRGAWTPEVEDVDAALEEGELPFALSGRKLKGSWVLVKTKALGKAPKGRPAWLLIKRGRS